MALIFSCQSFSSIVSSKALRPSNINAQNAIVSLEFSYFTDRMYLVGQFELVFGRLDRCEDPLRFVNPLQLQCQASSGTDLSGTKD